MGLFYVDAPVRRWRLYQRVVSPAFMGENCGYVEWTLARRILDEVDTSPSDTSLLCSVRENDGEDGVPHAGFTLLI